MTIETKCAKFEEGKTYFTTWNEETGRPHTSRYTIEKRTAKTVVISGSRSKIDYCDWADSEMAKVGYRKYIYAKDLFAEDTIKAQADSDAAWDKMDEEANRRYHELQAAKAEREEIMSTPLFTVEAQDAATNAKIELATADYQPQTNWENPHDFTITGDLSDRNINGRITAQRNAFKQEQEIREMKADGVQHLLKVKITQMHTYTNFYFETVIHPYKSLDALKDFGVNKIHEHDWRIETIDGKLIAKGTGSDDFKIFTNAKAETALTSNLEPTANDTLHEKIGDDILIFRNGKLVEIESLKYCAWLEFHNDGIRFFTYNKAGDCDRWDFNDFMSILAERGAISDDVKVLRHDSAQSVEAAIVLLKTENATTRKQMVDSLIRAMETCLLNIQAICLTKPTNLSAINREWELYQICNKALLRKEVA